MDFDLSAFCKIRSHSCTLNAEAFNFLQKEECDLKFYDIEKTTFFVGLNTEKYKVKSSQEFAAKSSYTLSYFLLALNIATLGHFEWAEKSSPVNTYSVVDNTKKTAGSIRAKNLYLFPVDAKRELTSDQIARAAMLMWALAKENKPYVRTEYLKGIYHLGFNFFDLHFQKDAFANFYRSFEYFITDRILKKCKLKNELKDIKAAFSIIGIGKDITEMFCSELYPLRSEQVMHSQKHQKDITWEQVIKMKMVADVVMNYHYKPIWESKTF